MVWGSIFLHTWEHHIIARLTLGISRIINLERTHSKSFSYMELNEAIISWSKSCTTLVALGGKRNIVILLNCKVKKSNDSSLLTCSREWVTTLSIIKDTLLLRLEIYIEAHPIQLSDTCHPCHLVCKPQHIICWQPPSKASWAYTFINNPRFQFVCACRLHNMSKSEMVLLNFAPTNFFFS